MLFAVSMMTNTKKAHTAVSTINSAIADISLKNSFINT